MMKNLITIFFYLAIMCNCNNRACLDMKTPRNVYLTAFYKRSFAYHTVKNRMPVIVTQVIDNLSRSKEKVAAEYGNSASEELKNVISEISKLKYEIQTNKVIRNLTSDGPDVKLYNNYISKQGNEDGQPTYFHTIWLLSECYMYRRIKEAFELTKTLKNYDPFQTQKEEAFNHALPLMYELGALLVKILDNSTSPNKKEFVRLLKLNLWGNKCDLSLSNGAHSNAGNLLDTSQLDPYCLSDHSDRIWEVISDKNESSNIVDFVLDNAGYELFTDFCIAHYLTVTNLARKIRFHVKSIPWFISDTMSKDIDWFLSQMRTNSNATLAQLGAKWTRFFADHDWTVEESYFWTLPFDYSYMATEDPALYKKLSEAKLIVFKGDLNYRKLFCEKNWDPTTSLAEAAQGFGPAKFCALRTIKSDIVCGLEEGVANTVESVDEKWRETGQYGLIQFNDKIVSLEES